MCRQARLQIGCNACIQQLAQIAKNQEAQINLGLIMKQKDTHISTEYGSASIDCRLYQHQEKPKRTRNFSSLSTFQAFKGKNVSFTWGLFCSWKQTWLAGQYPSVDYSLWCPIPFNFHLPDSIFVLYPQGPSPAIDVNYLRGLSTKEGAKCHKKKGRVEGRLSWTEGSSAQCSAPLTLWAALDCRNRRC